MRKNLAAASLLLMALAAPAVGQPPQVVAGSYEVKFEEMSTNCDPVRFTYTRGVVRIDTAKSSMRVNIETIPQMAGVPAKSGKINAKTPKKVATTVDGIDGKYGVSGRVDNTTGVLELVLVAELFRKDNGKPLCTQSWNVRGVKQTAATKPSNAKQKKSAATTLAMPALLNDR